MRLYLVGYANETLASIESNMMPEEQKAQIRIIDEPSLVYDALSLLKPNMTPPYLDLFQ
jgi:hypothetical protein